MKWKKFENVFWWQYKPVDEREEELYRKAYSRAFKTLFVLLLSVAAGISAVPKITGGVVGVAIIVIITIAYVAGWTVVRNEELSLQRENHMHGIRLMHRDTTIQLRNVYPALGLLIGLYGFILLAWPATVVVATAITFVIARVLLSVGAYSVTNHFEPAVRWMMVIFFPLTAILFGRMKERNVAGFIGALLLSVALYAACFTLPVIAAREIVTPFVITTNAFAPELPNGAYRFIDKRMYAPIEVNDFVIIQDGTWRVCRVTGRENETYTLQTASGERVAKRSEIVGRVMNESTWFTAFIESQMP